MRRFIVCEEPTVLVDFIFFFFNDTATTEIYTLSLHDALPISGYGFPIHLHDYADENYLVIGGEGKVLIENEIYNAEIHDIFYIPPGKWHCVFNPPENEETFHLFIFQTPRVSDELNALGYVEITKSQWDKLGLPKKDWEKDQ